MEVCLEEYYVAVKMSELQLHLPSCGAQNQADTKIATMFIQLKTKQNQTIHSLEIQTHAKKVLK